MEKPDRLHQIAYWAMVLLCVPAVLIGGSGLLSFAFTPGHSSDPRMVFFSGFPLLMATLPILFWDILGRFYRAPEKHRSQKWTVFVWVIGVISILIYGVLFLGGSLVMLGFYAHQSGDPAPVALGRMYWDFAFIAVPVVIGFILGCLGLIAVFRVIKFNRAGLQAA